MGQAVFVGLALAGLLFLGEGAACAQDFEAVIQGGEGEPGVLGLHALAVGIQLLGEGSDARLARFAALGE